MGSRLEKKSTAISKAIQGHEFDNEEGEEYEPSKFGGFPEYFRRKKIKLQNLDAQIRAESVDNPSIFRGIVCHVNGYTQPSLNDLHVMIVSHGGGFIQYLDGKTQVTHIIASNLTPKKAIDFKRYRIVKPAWIPDSLEAGRLLPWEDYRVLDEGAGQKLLQFDNGRLGSQINRAQRGYKDQTDASWYTRKFFKPDTSQQSSGQVPSAVSGQHGDVIEGLDEADFSTYDPDKVSSNDERYTNLDQLPGSTHDPHEQTLANRRASSQEATSSGTDDNAAESRGSQERKSLAQMNKVVEDGSAMTWPEPVVEHEPVQPALVTDETAIGMDISANPSKRKATHPEQAEPKRARMTAEEHNAELLSDPRIRKSSVLNPDFLEQYYRESRLHHLSTWKADLKAQLQALTAEKTASQKGKGKRAALSRRYILHVDFDSFFVAVSLKNFPQFREQPAVVAHGSGSGSEIASCNYAARAFGVKNGMWMKRAQDLCDHLKVLPYDFPAYEAASRLFYDAIMETGGIIQSVSIDEALVDMSTICHAAGGTDGVGIREGSIWREQQKADEVAQDIRDCVKDSTGCAVSVGIGGNILLAKVALRKAKPAGQYQIKPEQALDFLAPLQVQELPGVAYSIGGRLEEIGIKLVKDIREVTKERLVSVLGPKTGEKLWNFSRGIDKTEVGDQVIRKSVSAEVNWGVRFETQDQAEEFIDSLCGELHRRLLKERVRGRNLTMKVMRRAADAPLDPPKHLGHGKCDTYNKSVALGVATNEKDVLTKEALSMLRSWSFSPGELRGLGVQMTKLEPLKSIADGQQTSSQRRLQFSKPAAVQEAPNTRSAAEGSHLNGLNDSSQPLTQRHAHFKAPAIKNAPQAAPAQDDIQDDPETPRKPRPESMLAQQFVDSPSKKPLNVTGTQFILPSQVDPTVLSELPKDIRDRLAKSSKSLSAQRKLGFSRSEQLYNDADTERAPFAATALPSESQLDPSILAALPTDVRAEILSQYGKSDAAIVKSPAAAAKGAQAVLPQSPRKNRTARPSASRGRGRPRGGLMARLKAAGKNETTLTQANFVSGRLTDSATESEGDVAASEPDADFLAALPDDIRQEIVEQHRAAKLRKSAGMEVSRRRGRAVLTAPQGERLVHLEPRPSRPTFTTQRLWQIDELRSSIREWVGEFAEEGPYDEDVAALGKYLVDVIRDERNMRKAVDVTKWLDWNIDQIDNRVGVQKWGTARRTVHDAVQRGVKDRGLGKVNFD